MDRIERLLAYAAQNYGNSEQTTMRVMDAIKDGTERGLLTPAQRRRDLKHQHQAAGSHRQAQRARRAAVEARARQRRDEEIAHPWRAPDRPLVPVERMSRKDRLRGQVETLLGRGRG